MKKFFVLLLLTLSGSVLAQEATTDFQIRVYGGVDNSPPTTPVLSATTTTSTQVDLSWSTSTDNFSLAGYRIFRGDTSGATTTIATTSLQFFSDTGLAPSTTLSYQVQAFDTSFNYSTSSNIVTVTTPDLPVVVEESPENESTSATVARVVLRDLIIETGLSTSSISVETALPARIEFRWGKSDDYEMGYVVSSVFKRESKFFLDELEPGTTYAFEIVGFTPSGRETILAQDTFITQDPKKLRVPANVSRFTAQPSGFDVGLSWKLPAEEDIKYIRILRSHLDYPRFETDGAIVYQGKETSFLDIGIMNSYSPVFYTAFVYDTAGNISSGAITIAYFSQDVTNEIDDSTGLGDIDIVEQSTSTINFERLEPEMKMPEPRQVLIQQGDQSFSIADKLVLNNYEGFSIVVPIDSVAGNLKSIIATVLDPTDNRKTYSFLLRINRDRTAYEAIFSSLGVAGKSQLKLDIYDYEAFVVAAYQTPLEFVHHEEPQAVLFPDLMFKNMNFILLSSTLLFSAFLLLLLLWRHRSEDNH